ncbi:MAG: hypothetical protein MJY69_05370 [Bacteroidales bacterium]|nr:hypothetical protein [Bacteroidales bacterium]
MTSMLNNTDVKEQLDHLKKSDHRLCKLIDSIGDIDIHYYSDIDGYTFLVREIVGQMISAQVKKILYNRFVILCDGEITAHKVAAFNIEKLRDVGLSTSKSRYIINLSKEISEGRLNLGELDNKSDEEVFKTLLKICGVGKWTAKMYLLFYLKRNDILPVEDMAFIQAYKWLYDTDDIKPSSIEKQCQNWHPYASLASRYMYKALDSGLTKIPINEFLSKSQ